MTSEVCSLRPGIQFQPNVHEKETFVSLALRTTAVVIGILALMMGLGILFGGFPFVINTNPAWSLTCGGALLTLVGIALKCVKVNSHKNN